VVGAALVLAFSVTAVTTAVAMQPGQPGLVIASVAQAPCQQQRALPRPTQLSGQFEPDSSILLTPGGTCLTTLARSARSATAAQADSEGVRGAGRDWVR